MAVVLVTGGSSGIGLATARRLAAAGDHVFAASRHPEGAGGIQGVTPLALDVADPGAAEPAVARVVAEAGRIDVLVNNAGATAVGAFEDVDEETGRQLFEVNFFGPMRLARAVVGPMRAQGGGRIVNVTSMNDALPTPYGGWYSASKAALASASVVLDAEVHRFGIAVSVVAPGLFRTAMAEGLGDVAAPPGSVHADVVAAMIAAAPARLETAADPDIVAAAVERCIREEDPPPRIVVGKDALAFERLVQQGPEALAKALRQHIASMASQ